MPNPYLLKDNDNYSYEFTTKQSIKYLVYFLDYNFMFDSFPNIAENIFSFNIDVIEGNTNSVKEDERIGISIVNIFKLFFENINNAVVYVCDSADERQYARKRKFDFWFNKYNDGSIIKKDNIIKIEGVAILNSLLLNKANINFTEIVSAYNLINETSTDK